MIVLVTWCVLCFSNVVPVEGERDSHDSSASNVIWGTDSAKTTVCGAVRTCCSGLVNECLW